MFEDGAVSGSPLLAAPALALASVQAGLVCSGLSLSLAQARQAYLDATALGNAVDALRLHAVRVMDAHEGEAGGVFYPGSVAARWLAENAMLTAGRARALVQVARTADPEADAATGNGGKGGLPMMGAALADGLVTREHLEIAVRALSHLPTGMVREHAEAIDALFTEHAKHLPASDASQMATALIATLAPGSVGDFADRAQERRWLRVRTDRTGMVRVEGQLDPVGGALFKTLIEHLVSLARAAAADTAAGTGVQGHEGTGSEGTGNNADAATDEDSGADAGAGVTEMVTPEQYLADAAVELARYAQVGLGVAHPRAEPVRVSVIVTPEQMSHPHGEHEGTEAGPAGPGPAEPWSPEPEIAEPEIAEPEIAEPEIAEPEFAEPGAAAEAEPTAPEPATPTPEPAGSEPAAAELAAAECAVVSPVPGWCRAPGPAVCEATGVLSVRALGALVCDAVMDRVVISRAGTVVSLTSLGRLATRAQRRALAARDGGCTWPGCSAKATWSDAHHVVWWSRGGATSVGNLCLLCQHHHTQIHREQWSIVMIAGVPWFRPPPWVDPDQRLRRNTRHRTLAQTITAAHRLAAGEPIGDLLTEIGPWTTREGPEAPRSTGMSPGTGTRGDPPGDHGDRAA